MKFVYKILFWNLCFPDAVLPAEGQIHTEKGGEEYAKM
jgi:hypothetical protein